jgi:hypothetical protein
MSALQLDGNMEGRPKYAGEQVARSTIILLIGQEVVAAKVAGSNMPKRDFDISSWS